MAFKMYFIDGLAHSIFKLTWFFFAILSFQGYTLTASNASQPNKYILRKLLCEFFVAFLANPQALLLMSLSCCTPPPNKKALCSYSSLMRVVPVDVKCHNI